VVKKERKKKKPLQILRRALYKNQKYNIKA